MAGSQRITAEGAVTTLASTDVLYKDNPSTGSGKIAYSNLAAQIDARYLSGGKLLSSLVPSSFAGGITYKGTVAGASVPASSGTTGDYYLVSSAGTSQAITWAVGDFAVWNGAAWQKVAMAGAYTTPNDVANLVNPRATRQGLAFDGSAVASIGGSNSLGTKWTLSWMINIDTAAQHAVVFTSTSFWGVRAGGGVFNSVIGDFSDAVVLSGKDTLVTLVSDGSIITPYINGAAKTPVAYSTPEGIPNQLSFAGNPFIIRGFLAENRALSAAEIQALYNSSVPPTGDISRGVNDSGATVYAGAAMLSGANSTFASDTGFWTKTGTAAIAGGNLSLSANDDSITHTGLIANGSAYRVTAVVTTLTASSIDIGVQGGGTTTISATGTVSVDFSAGTDGNGTFFVAQSGAGSVVIDTLTITPIGLLCYPDPQQPGDALTWSDLSGNSAHIVLPSSGVSWSVPGSAPFHVRGTTNTNGNQQMLGAAVLPANCQILRARARARTNTPTITLGTASGGAQIVASVALSTTWKDLTIALTGGIVSSASSVWVGSNSTDVVEIDITAEPLSF